MLALSWLVRVVSSKSWIGTSRCIQTSLRTSIPRQVRALGARRRLLDTVYLETFVVAPAPQVPGNLSGEHGVNSVGRSLGPVVSLVWLLQPRPLRTRYPR